MIGNLLNDKKENDKLLQDKNVEYEDLKEINNQLSAELRTLHTDREDILRHHSMLGNLELNFLNSIWLTLISVN